MLVQLVLPIFFTIVINPLNLIFNQFHKKFQRFDFTNFFFMNFQFHEKNSMHKISTWFSSRRSCTCSFSTLSQRRTLYTPSIWTWNGFFPFEYRATSLQLLSSSLIPFFFEGFVLGLPFWRPENREIVKFNSRKFFF